MSEETRIQNITTAVNLLGEKDYNFTDEEQDIIVNYLQGNYSPSEEQEQKENQESDILNPSLITSLPTGTQDTTSRYNSRTNENFDLLAVAGSIQQSINNNESRVNINKVTKEVEYADKATKQVAAYTQLAHIYQIPYEAVDDSLLDYHISTVRGMTDPVFQDFVPEAPTDLERKINLLVNVQNVPVEDLSQFLSRAEYREFKNNVAIDSGDYIPSQDNYKNTGKVAFRNSDGEIEYQTATYLPDLLTHHFGENFITQGIDRFSSGIYPFTYLLDFYPSIVRSLLDVADQGTDFLVKKVGTGNDELDEFLIDLELFGGDEGALGTVLNFTKQFKVGARRELDLRFDYLNDNDAKLAYFVGKTADRALTLGTWLRAMGKVNGFGFAGRTKLATDGAKVVSVPPKSQMVLKRLGKSQITAIGLTLAHEDLSMEERIDLYKILSLYLATPSISGLANTKGKVYALDLFLNLGIDVAQPDGIIAIYNRDDLSDLEKFTESVLLVGTSVVMSGLTQSYGAEYRPVFEYLQKIDNAVKLQIEADYGRGGKYGRNGRIQSPAKPSQSWYDYQLSTGRISPFNIEQAVVKANSDLVKTEKSVDGEIAKLEFEIKNEASKPTDTEVKPTDTEVKPTDTEVKPTDTEVKPTDTEVKPTDTEVKPTETTKPKPDELVGDNPLVNNKIKLAAKKSIKKVFGESKGQNIIDVKSNILNQRAKINKILADAKPTDKVSDIISKIENIDKEVFNDKQLKQYEKSDDPIDFIIKDLESSLKSLKTVSETTKPTQVDTPKEVTLPKTKPPKSFEKANKILVDEGVALRKRIKDQQKGSKIGQRLQKLVDDALNKLDNEANKLKQQEIKQTITEKEKTKAQQKIQKLTDKYGEALQKLKNHNEQQKQLKLDILESITKAKKSLNSLQSKDRSKALNAFTKIMKAKTGEKLNEAIKEFDEKVAQVIEKSQLETAKNEYSKVEKKANELIKSGKVTIEIKNTLKSLIDKVNVNKISGELDAIIQNSKSFEAIEMALSMKMALDYLVDKPIKQMTAIDYKTNADIISGLLKQMNSIKKEIAQNGRTKSQQAVLNQYDILSDTPIIKVDRLNRTETQLNQRLDNIFSKTRNKLLDQTLPPLAIARTLDNFNASGEFTKLQLRYMDSDIIKASIDSKISDKVSPYNSILSKYTKTPITKKGKLKKETTFKVGLEKELKSLTLTNAEKLLIYMQSKDPTVKQTQLDKGYSKEEIVYRFTENQLDKIINSIPADVKAGADAMIDAYRNIINPAVNEMSVRVVGYEIAREAMYSGPAYRANKTKLNLEEKFSSLDDMSGFNDAFIKAISSGNSAWTARRENNLPLRFYDPVSMFNRMTRMTTEYAARADVLKEINSFMYNASQPIGNLVSLQQFYKNNGFEGTFKTFKTYVNDINNPFRYTRESQAEREVNKVLKFGREFTGTALKFNPKVQMMQVGSLPIAAIGKSVTFERALYKTFFKEIGLATTKEAGVTSTLGLLKRSKVANTDKYIKFLSSRSPYLRMRYQEGGVGAVITDRAKTTKGQERGFGGISRTDSLVIYSIWKANESVILEKNPTIDKNSTEFNKLVERETVLDILKSQPDNSSYASRPELSRSRNNLIMTWAQFSSATNKLHYQEYISLQQLIKSIRNGTYSSKDGKQFLRDQLKLQISFSVIAGIQSGWENFVVDESNRVRGIEEYTEKIKTDKNYVAKEFVKDFTKYYLLNKIGAQGIYLRAVSGVAAGFDPALSTLDRVIYEVKSFRKLIKNIEIANEIEDQAGSTARDEYLKEKTPQIVDSSIKLLNLATANRLLAVGNLWKNYVLPISGKINAEKNYNEWATKNAEKIDIEKIDMTPIEKSADAWLKKNNYKE